MTTIFGDTALAPHLATRLTAIERDYDPRIDMREPEAMRHTWSGQFGDKGLVAIVQDVTTEGNLDIAQGRIMTPSGELAGDFARSVSLARTGDELIVNHDSLYLDNEHRGTGFASAFNDRAEGIYREHGVRAVLLDAEDDGAVAWARRGWELVDRLDDLRVADQTQLAERAAMIIGDAYGTHRISHGDFDAVLPRMYPGSGVVDTHHIVGVQGIAELGDIGRRILEGTTWKGIKLLR